MVPLTARQLQVLEFIEQHQARTGSAPTLREISDFLGCASTHTAFCHIAALVKKGWAASAGRSKSRSIRSIRQVHHQCPNCGHRF